MTEEELVKCPKCKEDIAKGATKCKHCGADLRNWFVKHKIISAFLGLVVIGIIVGMTQGPTSNTETVNSNKDSGSSATKTNEPAKETLTISNSTVKDNGFGTTEVVGEVKNNDTTIRSATLQATFYDKAGKILGTASGAVNEIAPNDTKTFTLMSTDNVTGYANFKVQVDTLI